MIDDLFTDLEEQFSKAHRNLSRELSTIRTGRANPALLDRVRIDYYGTPTPVQQLANVKVPEPRLLLITPFDRSTLSAIERAIHQSDLGLTPNNDGTVLRISIPPLTRDRREELAKQARKMGEEAKIAIRNARRDSNELVKSIQKDGDISEDESRRAQTRVQEATDRATTKVDELVAAKEKELLES